MTPIPWKTEEVLEATDGRCLGGRERACFTGISIDSRTVAPGELFVAVQGENHDGHRFLSDAVGKGAVGVIFSGEKAPSIPWQEWADRGTCCITVPNTVGALGSLAAYRRMRSGVSVIAVTGSNGKTTTRSMTAGIVGRRYEILSPQGNFNNEIGLPLTLFRLTRNHRWTVLEMGMNHTGEIRRLARIARPDIGVITNIGPAHLEGLGSIERIAAAKGELLEEMDEKAIAVLNADDAHIRRLAGKARGRVFFFGQSPESDIRAHSVRVLPKGAGFTLALPGESLPVQLNVPGAFMVQNALAAAAAAYLAGLSPKDIQSGLEVFRPVHGRMQAMTTRSGVHLIDDTYNANPASMKAAGAALSGLKEGGRAIFVAGDMFELGDESAALHESVGAALAASGIDFLFAAGPHAEHTVTGAVREGFPANHARFGKKEDIINWLKQTAVAGDWVLVKGSRGMRMETVFTALREWADG